MLNRLIPITRMALLIFCLTHINALAMAQTTNSAKLFAGNKPFYFVELYTSEGCSSCPPADEWLNRSDEHRTEGFNLYSLAYHVDYWDYLGWKDPYAQAAFSDRQRRFGKTTETGRVYTPMFVVNGNEWRGWFDDERVTSLKLRQPEGELSAEIKTGKLTVEYIPSSDGEQTYSAHIAYLANNEISNVLAGENQGKQLVHNYVVTELVSGELQGSDDSKSFSRTFQHDAEGADIQLLIWIVRTGEPYTPLNVLSDR